MAGEKHTNDDLRRIGARLLRLRKARGLSCLDVQHATGIYFNSVAAIERGEVNFKILTLKKLAAFYGVPWTALESDETPVLVTDVIPNYHQVRKLKGYMEKVTADIDALLQGHDVPASEPPG